MSDKTLGDHFNVHQKKTRIKPSDQRKQTGIDLEYQVNRLKMVATISQTISSILSLDTLCSTTVKVIRDSFKFYNVAILLLDRTHHYVTLQVNTNDIHESPMVKFRIDATETANSISRCMKNCQAYITSYKDKIHSVENTYIFPQTRSELLLPLVYHEQSIGVLSIQSDKPAVFSHVDIPIFQTMADQIANSIENARLFEQMTEARYQAEARLHEMQIMQRISSAVTGTFDLDKVMDALFKALSQEMRFSLISLSVIMEAEKEMRNLRTIGFNQNNQNRIWTFDQLSGTLLMNVIEKGCIEIVEGGINQLDVDGNADTILKYNEVVRLFIPVLSRGKSIGVLEAGYKKQDRPVTSPEEIQLLMGLADQTAITIENTRLIDQLNYERDLLHTLMENIPDAIYFKDNKSRFIRASKALANKNGLPTPEELLGKTDFDLFTKEHAQQAFDDEQRILRTAVPEIDIEEKETWQDSRITWVSTTKMPLRDKNGRIIGTFGVSRDITKRKEMEDALKQAEEQLRQSNNALEQRVAERTGDLEKSNKLLTSHIEQLNFLNSSVYNLSPITSIDNLLPFIFNIFMSRFSDAQGALCFHTDDGFSCLYATERLNVEHNRSCLEEAAHYFISTDLLQPLFIENRLTHTHFSTITWTGIEDLLGMVAIPLIINNTCKVLLQIFVPVHYSVTFAIEQTLLTTLSAHAAICVSNTLYYHERAEKARIDGELDAARSIQRRFTPNHRPDIPHINLTGIYYPAYQVGGDYLDYFQTENGDWVVAIADVCGKGIPAALLMTTMRSAFRIEAKKETSAKRLLSEINKFMVLNLDDKSFVTALCLIISKDGSHMTYARAGHPFLLKLGHSGNIPTNITSKGPALGLIPDTHDFLDMTEEKSFPLVAGDRFLVYTDGLIEAVDPQKNAYGFTRLQHFLSVNSNVEPDQLIDNIITDVKYFTCGAPYNDDLTILALRVF